MKHLKGKTQRMASFLKSSQVQFRFMKLRLLQVFLSFNHGNSDFMLSATLLCLSHITFGS
jgi:hypothetical protein